MEPGIKTEEEKWGGAGFEIMIVMWTQGNVDFHTQSTARQHWMRAGRFGGGGARDQRQNKAPF